MSYVSSLYGGAASDKFIVQNSGVLNLIEAGDNVMADRGFDIDVELNKRGASLNIPPFRNQNIFSCQANRLKPPAVLLKSESTSSVQFKE